VMDSEVKAMMLLSTEREDLLRTVLYGD